MLYGCHCLNYHSNSSVYLPPSKNTNKDIGNEIDSYSVLINSMGIVCHDIDIARCA